MPHQESQVATATWRVTPDLMCILDLSGCFVAANPAWEATFGRPSGEMIGRSYRDFLHPDDVDASVEAFQTILAGQPVCRFENRYATIDGDYRWLSWVAVPDEDRVFCTIRDTTADKEREQTISDQRDEALLRKQFLAILGHDLRNPLASLAAGMRLLSRDDLSDASREILQGMHASSVRMSELIENLMDLARIQLGGGINIDRETVTDFEDRAAGIVREIESVHDHARIRLHSTLSGPVRCDAPRLMQVLSNLIGNAVTHGRPDHPIDVTVDDPDGRLVVSVCNQGDPIPEAERDTLFQPFFKRHEEDGHSSPQGLGLGLFICSEIVAAHDGRIYVTSDEVETCFVVDIPA